MVSRDFPEGHRSFHVQSLPIEGAPAHLKPEKERTKEGQILQTM
jgi:hypothetical protein